MTFKHRHIDCLTNNKSQIIPNPPPRWIFLFPEGVGEGFSHCDEGSNPVTMRYYSLFYWIASCLTMTEQDGFLFSWREYEMEVRNIFDYFANYNNIY